MTNQNITPEVIKALRTLRINVRSDETSESVAQAIVILDNAGIFSKIDEAPAPADRIPSKTRSAAERRRISRNAR